MTEFYYVGTEKLGSNVDLKKVTLNDFLRTISIRRNQKTVEVHMFIQDAINKAFYETDETNPRVIFSVKFKSGKSYLGDAYPSKLGEIDIIGYEANIEDLEFMSGAIYNKFEKELINIPLSGNPLLELAAVKPNVQPSRVSSLSTNVYASRSSIRPLLGKLFSVLIPITIVGIPFYMIITSSGGIQGLALLGQVNATFPLLGLGVFAIIAATFLIASVAVYGTLSIAWNNVASMFTRSPENAPQDRLRLNELHKRLEDTKDNTLNQDDLLKRNSKVLVQSNSKGISPSQTDNHSHKLTEALKWFLRKK